MATGSGSGRSAADAAPSEADGKRRVRSAIRGRALGATGSAIRPLRLIGRGSDAAWAERLLDRSLGGRRQARLGVVVDALEGPGLVALGATGRPVGLIAWTIGGPGSDPDVAEVRVLAVNDRARRRGVGGALLAAAEAELARTGAHRAWLVTTNDNLEALAFYQRRGWYLGAIHAGAVDLARATLKPAIPRLGVRGIPIRDELVLSKNLARGS